MGVPSLDGAYSLRRKQTTTFAGQDQRISPRLPGRRLPSPVEARARLRSHRAKLMQIVVEAGLSGTAVDIAALRLALNQPGRL